MRIDVERLRKEHDRFLAEHDAMVRGALYDAGVSVQAEVATHPQFTPRTGGLQKATKTRIVRTSGGRLLRVSNDAKQAHAIEKGARPHKITARAGKALRFFTSSGIVFRRSVNHPGNRPYWFLRRATDVSAERMGRALNAGMSRIARIRF